MQDVTAAILAGGRGTRLQSVLQGGQKVVARVHDRPFLYYILDWLADSAVGRVVLLTGHNTAEVQEKMGQTYRGIEINYSIEKEPLGTAGALRLALPYLGGTNLVLNGDSYFPLELSAMLDFHRSHQSQATLAAAEVDDTARFGALAINSADRLLSFAEKSQPGAGWINAGIYLIEQSLIERIPENRTISLEKEIFPDWVNVPGLMVFRAQGTPFIDIGLPETFAMAESIVGPRHRDEVWRASNPVADAMFAHRGAVRGTFIKAGVGVIITNSSGRVLLEKRADCGLWGLPGGKIDPGESITEAAIREAREETGLLIEVRELVGVYSSPAERIVVYPDNGDTAQLVDTVVHASIQSGELSVSPESLELQFFPLDNLPTDIVPPALRPLIDFQSGKRGQIA